MPATVTVAGTPTAITVDTTRMAATGPNVQQVAALNADAWKTADGSGLSEITQFVQQMATAWGIGYWPAFALIFHAMKAQTQMATPGQLGDTAASPRTYG